MFLLHLASKRDTEIFRLKKKKKTERRKAKNHKNKVILKSENKMAFDEPIENRMKKTQNNRT